MSFDRIAPHYRWMERWLAGRAMHRCRTAFLDRISPPRHALLPGEGHGRFLAELIARYPGARVTVVEASAGMIEQARSAVIRRGLRLDCVQFIHADALTWELPAQTFDLIAANFVFDCFRADDLALLIARLAHAATPSAQCLVADFREPPSGPSRWRARLVIATLYRFFRWTARLPASRLTSPDRSLETHGFRLQERRLFDWGLLHSDLWTRGIDASNLLP